MPGAGDEAAILSRLIRPERDDLSPEAAQSILQLAFDEQDRARMHELAVRAQSGELTDGEQVELESYRRVGRILDLLRSKARRSLKRAGLAA
ncbi:hypothetical protein SOCE26_078150 [Sorangium cellulosum]|uniref:Uncharacterized protein n=1 Tax=Sorangium cellulosum TaxID=56 RepID=A0A2L0F417_SORCE|nr:hypothetical protein [Sorangium cellulosum]AUX46310.1 hypothetical protein SOCE26_078150 [Sorangium cellulosum]